MLQLPNASKSGQIQGCAFPSAGSGVHGEYVEASSDQLASLTPGRSKQEILPVPVQAESRIGVPRSEMSTI